MPDDEKLYESVHNYTKFKLVEMLIDRLNGGKTKLDDLNYPFSYLYIFQLTSRLIYI